MKMTKARGLLLSSAGRQLDCKIGCEAGRYEASRATTARCSPQGAFMRRAVDFSPMRWHRPMRTWLAPFLFSLMVLCFALAAQADGVAVPGIPQIGQSGAAVTYPPTSGTPTWTAQTSAANASCGFVTTCSISSVSVTSGLVVIGIGGENEDRWCSRDVRSSVQKFRTQLIFSSVSVHAIIGPIVASGGEHPKTRSDFLNGVQNQGSRDVRLMSLRRWGRRLHEIWADEQAARITRFIVSGNTNQLFQMAMSK
jgi:hypothetical protein